MPYQQGIISQLIHDAPFAWFLRDAAEYNPNFRKRELDELEERLQGYMRCLILTETQGETILSKIRPDDWGAVFTIAYAAISTSNEKAFLLAVDAVETEAQSRELCNALKRFPFKRVKSYILNIAHHNNPWVQAAVIRAVAHHFDKINPDWLLPHLKSEVPAVRVAALRVIGDEGLIAHKDQITAHLDHAEASIRFQAAFSGNLLGIDLAYKTLLTFCFTDNPYLRKALGLVHHLHDIPAIERAVPRIQNSELSTRIKAYNIAMAGLVDWMSVLLEWMKDSEYAPLAGEAFCFITGADLDADDLLLRNLEISVNQEIPLTQKRKQDHWAQAYENDLPWPDPDAVAAWWETNRQRFKQGTRYLAGRTLTEENLLQVKEEGTQPQRHQAELILRLLHINSKNPS
ncbi:MAG: hypothetical protein AB2557_10310 [Candidatus Thiodiazotropha sp.]